MEYLLCLQELRSDALNTVLMAVTDFITSPVVYVGIALLYWCFNKRAASLIAMNISVGSMVNQALKNTFCIYRPWIRYPEITPVPAAMDTATGYSFPSGHTQLASGEFLSIAVWQKKRKWLVGVCIAITLLVMFTRNYLGVHTLEDVLVSLAVSLVVIFAGNNLSGWVDKGKNRDIAVLGVGMVLCAAFIVYVTIKPYPIDYTQTGEVLVNPKDMINDCYSAAGCVVGFLIGRVAERHILNFRTDVSKSAKIMRGIVGTALLLMLVLFAMEPVTALHPYWGEFGFFVLAFIFILFIYPLMFVIWERVAYKKQHRPYKESINM